MNRRGFISRGLAALGAAIAVPFLPKLATGGIIPAQPTAVTFQPDGTRHFHYHALDTEGVAEILKRDRAAVVKIVNEAARRGAIKPQRLR